MPEAGRAIIRDQIQIGGTALPWADKAMFAELMLGWKLRPWHEASAFEKPVLMDRGVPNVVGYLTLCDLRVPTHVEAAAKKYCYNRMVFIAPYWGPFSGRTPKESRTTRKRKRLAGSWLKLMPTSATNLSSFPGCQS